MRNNNLIVLIVAVVLGGFAALLARNWLISHAQTAQRVLSLSPPCLLLSAAAQRRKPQRNSLGRWDLPNGAFTNKQAVLKDGRRMALAAISRNEPILRDKITAPGQLATLSTVLSPVSARLRSGWTTCAALRASSNRATGWMSS